MVYTEKLQVEKKDVDRWNFLLSKDIDEMTEREVDVYNVKENNKEGGYEVKFSDGSYITIDLYSGSQNYYDDIVWHNADETRSETFDCLYSFADEPKEEFTVGEDTYVIEFEVID